MPQQPIIVYNPRQTSAQDELTRIIAAEKLSSGFQGFSEMLNKGIEAYQNAKKRKQDQDLASIQAAGALVGGVDLLPTETKNKIPGIINMDLPRDDKGNVVITPTAKDLLDRATKDAMAKDPEGFARVLSGTQEKALDPTDIALKREATAQKDRADALDAKVKIFETDAANKRADLERADKEKQNIRDNETRLLTAGAGAKEREAHDNAPSDFWIDNKTGEVLTKPAAQMKLDLNEKFEDRFYNPTNGALKQFTDAKTAQSRVDRARTQNQVDQTRQALMEARIKTLGSKDDNFKFAMDMLRKSQLAKNPESEKYFRDEVVRMLGQEANPDEYGWMI